MTLTSLGHDIRLLLDAVGPCCAASQLRAPGDRAQRGGSVEDARDGLHEGLLLAAPRGPRAGRRRLGRGRLHRVGAADAAVHVVEVIGGGGVRGRRQVEALQGGNSIGFKSRPKICPKTVSQKGYLLEIAELQKLSCLHQKRSKKWSRKSPNDLYVIELPP